MLLLCSCEHIDHNAKSFWNVTCGMTEELASLASLGHLAQPVLRKIVTVTTVQQSSSLQDLTA